jgi:hypothetical protein
MKTVTDFGRFHHGMGAGKQFKTAIVSVNVGLVGYSFWQTTDTVGGVLPPTKALVTAGFIRHA